MGERTRQPATAKERLERVPHDVDERVARFAAATLQDYERRRQRLIDDVAGDLSDDPGTQGVEDQP
jgi:hypothetical protein